ncbi:hypothetical protein OC835_003377 [Tilletia horrida]|nr:hypothetical protein OC835_003377 [Tilletia horrida]
MSSSARDADAARLMLRLPAVVARADSSSADKVVAEPALPMGDGSFHGHPSAEIGLALASHAKHMHAIDSELAHLDPAHPQGADGVANALLLYALAHHDQGDWPAGVIPKKNKTTKNITDHVLLSAAAESASADTVSLQLGAAAEPLPYPGAFSLAALLSRSTWAATIYGVVFILFGLVLLFFGYASFYWARKVRFGGGDGDRAAKRDQGGLYAALGPDSHLPQLGDGTSIAERLLGPSPSPRTRAAAAAAGKKGRNSGTTAASYYGQKPSNSKPRLAFPTGIGGTITTALFFANLVMFITSATLARKPVSPDQPPPTLAAGAFFAAMLLPFLAGLLLLSRLSFLPRPLAGLAGACAMTRLLTALFGIHTLLIRIVILAVFALLLAAPLIPLPGRAAYVQRLLCTITTAVWGGVSVLDGVVLLVLSQARLHMGVPIQTAEQGDFMPTPPGVQAAASWLDTWSLLIAPDGSLTVLNATEHWGSSAFKGCIAASILVPLFGLAFQAILQHRAAAGKLGFFGIWGGGGALGTRGKDADEEWNDILGSYTQRYEKGVRELEGSMPANYANLGGGVDPITGRPVHRAGLFEPAPSAWSKFTNLLGGKSSGTPARYGNLGASQAPVGHMNGVAPSGSTTAPVPGGSGFRTLEAVAAASDLDLSLVAGSVILGNNSKFAAGAGGRKKRKKGAGGKKSGPARFQSTVAKDLDSEDEEATRRKGEGRGYVSSDAAGGRKRSDSATLHSDDSDEDEKASPPYESDSDDYDSDSTREGADEKSRPFPTPVSFHLPSSKKAPTAGSGVTGLPPLSSSSTTPPPMMMMNSTPLASTTVSPRPPSYRTNTDISASSGSGSGGASRDASGSGAGSGLSGTTAGSSPKGAQARQQQQHQQQQRATSLGGPILQNRQTPPQRSPSTSSSHGGVVPLLITSTRGATTRSVSSPVSVSPKLGGGGILAASSPPPMPAPPAGVPAANGGAGGNALVPATPSLVNAISRIQRAQEQARAWHAAAAASAAQRQKDEAAAKEGKEGPKR